LLLEFLFGQPVQCVEAKFKQGSEQAFRWACLVDIHWLLQMAQDRLFAKVVYHKKVRFVEARVQDARQYRFVVWQELLILLFGRLLLAGILLLDDFHECADVGVVDF